MASLSNEFCGNAKVNTGRVFGGGGSGGGGEAAGADCCLEGDTLRAEADNSYCIHFYSDSQNSFREFRLLQTVIPYPPT